MSTQRTNESSLIPKPVKKKRKSFYASQIGEHQETKVVEVPIATEVIKHVSKKVVVEVEKKVPIWEVEWVDREIKVPQIHYQEKVVFSEHVKEIIKQVPEKRIIEVPVEKIREIPKVEKREIVKTVVVEGDEVEIPLPYLVDEHVVIPKQVFVPLPTVVTQVVRAHISESETESVDIVLNEYVPKLVEKEVYVPCPVGNDAGRRLQTSSVTEYLNPLDHTSVPSPQWNSLIRDQNLHIIKTDHPRHGTGMIMIDSLLRRPGDDIPFLNGLGSYHTDPKSADWYTEETFNCHQELLHSVQIVHG